MCFKSEVAILWIGEVEHAGRIDDIITAAFITGRPALDFENLDFKIASRLGKILTGNFKQQVTTAEVKAQPETRSHTGKQIAWMIYDFSKICGDTEALLDFRVSKVQLTNDNVQAFDTKWSAV